jgi:ABC-type multidrug transport system fused ATPase/permease subunit
MVSFIILILILILILIFICFNLDPISTFIHTSSKVLLSIIMSSFLNKAKDLAEKASDKYQEKKGNSGNNNNNQQSSDSYSSGNNQQDSYGQDSSNTASSYGRQGMSCTPFDSSSICLRASTRKQKQPISFYGLIKYTRKLWLHRSEHISGALVNCLK